MRAADLVAASGKNPGTLPVAFRLQAGDPATEPLAPGSAARIMTGAPLPPETVAEVERLIARQEKRLKELN